MRTKNELNAVYESLAGLATRQKDQYICIAAVLSMFIGIVGIFVLSFYLVLFGLIGVFVFAGYLSYKDAQMASLKAEWHRNGYGLKKYPYIGK